MNAIEHAQKICAWFTSCAVIKYMKGQEEHGGRLWRKNVQGAIREEVVDLVIYYHVLEEQLGQVEILLGNALFEMKKQRNPAKEFPPEYFMIEKAYNILCHGNIEGFIEEDK